MRFTIFALVSLFLSPTVSAAIIMARQVTTVADGPGETAIPKKVNLAHDQAPRDPIVLNRHQQRQFHNADFGSSGSPPASNLESESESAAAADPVVLPAGNDTEKQPTPIVTSTTSQT